MSVTEILASFVVENHLEDIPTNTYDEAKRALVNYMGCAIGGANEPALENALAVLPQRDL